MKASQMAQDIPPGFFWAEGETLSAILFPEQIGEDHTCQSCLLKRWADSTLPKEAALVYTRRGLLRF